MHLRELETAESSLPAVTPHLRNVRGYALMNAGRLEEALVEYLAVVEVRPDFATAWGYAAHCAFSLGNPTDGLRYAKRATSPWGTQRPTTLGTRVPTAQGERVVQGDGPWRRLASDRLSDEFRLHEVDVWSFISAVAWAEGRRPGRAQILALGPL